MNIFVYNGKNKIFTFTNKNPAKLQFVFHAVLARLYSLNGQNSNETE